jgi:hypothetical protein
VSEVGVVLVIVVVLVFAIANGISNARDTHAIESGKSDYFVKIAASGKGSTYHALSCNRSRGAVMITLAEARAKGYAPCSSCGGKASVRPK